MGGDGGTLNNSRHEHTRLRAAVLRLPDVAAEAARLRQRSSVTHCALTKELLQPPHVVADRLGQLFSKEALLRHILHRHAHPPPLNNSDDALAHIRSIKKDTTTVHLSPTCPLTHRTITADARFALCWTCGRAATAVAIPGTGASPNCPLCGAAGQRVLLGMTLEHRLRIQRAIVADRHLKKVSKNSLGIRKKRRPKAATPLDVHPTVDSETYPPQPLTTDQQPELQPVTQPPASTSSTPTPG